MKRTETREQVFRLIYSSLIQKEMSEEQIEICKRNLLWNTNKRRRNRKINS